MRASQRVMILCPKTNVAVHTGLWLPEDYKLPARDPALGHKYFLCSACGQRHNVTLAFLEGEDPPPNKAILKPP